MIEYVKNISDFWSESFKGYTFPHKVNVGQRDTFHSNYFDATISQAFGDEIPHYQQFLDLLDIERGSISVICLEPGQVIPVHTDNFYKLRQEYNVSVEDCIRYLIFLEDWQFGHFVEFDELVITKWKKGDVWKFDSRSQHHAANSSQANFTTCQVNTFLNI